jgi:CRISPR system Cascade subunit CasD
MPGFLLLRLEAPLMSFGGPMVDNIGRTRSFPGQAQITGLLANALGYRHADADLLERLQTRLRMATALARPGEVLRDYHTVDLGRPHLVDTGWTTRGVPETRGGASSDTTHIRYRWYLADALVVVALALDPANEEPTLANLAAALRYPARPLFIGRKSCLPAAPILLGEGETEATSAAAALQGAMRSLSLAKAGRVAVEMDERLATAADAPHETERLIDRRDWRNQMHTGARAVRRFQISHEPPPPEGGSQ